MEVSASHILHDDDRVLLLGSAHVIDLDDVLVVHTAGVELTLQRLPPPVALVTVLLLHDLHRDLDALPPS